MKRFILTLLCFLCFGIAFGNEPSVVSGDYIIDDWKIYISEEGNISIKEYKGSSENVAIPDNFDGFPVVSIGEKAFQNKHSVVSVTIPDSVTYIGRGAFYSCSNLKSVVIGKSVETISVNAFRECMSLEKIVIPDSVKKIKEYAFCGCENLTSVDFGNSLEGIGDYAFSSCSSLTSVVIPDSVTYIGDYAFSNCGSLTDFTIGKSLLSFDYSRIIGSETLHTITLKNAGTDLINVPSSVQVIKPKAKSLREQMQERNDK
ncbi:MAG: leucine-rich repeat domain-containing protein [Treponema sp.]|nr:leucine-rich repeat domain-containing protein [Treponema sp.]MDY5838848.1 leucine-rich repeat domain-containing protein [Treponema sp.]